MSEEVLEKLQIDKPFEIQQWTPIRVLHRRSLLKRPRTIYSVKAFAVKSNGFFKFENFIREIIFNDFLKFKIFC